MSEHEGSMTIGGSSEDGIGTEEVLDLEAVVLADPRDRAELLSALLETEQQRDGLLDDLLRARADFENYRKRVARDAAVQREHGRVDVVAALIDALDDLDRTEAAIAALDGAGAGGPSDVAGDGSGLAHGIGLVASRLRTTLEGLGLERIDGADVAFDPTVHEAVQHVSGGDGGQRVVEVLRPGYRLGERVLRAAMVVVAG